MNRITFGVLFLLLIPVFVYAKNDLLESRFLKERHVWKLLLAEQEQETEVMMSDTRAVDSRRKQREEFFIFYGRAEAMDMRLGSIQERLKRRVEVLSAEGAIFNGSMRERILEVDARLVRAKKGFDAMPILFERGLRHGSFAEVRSLYQTEIFLNLQSAHRLQILIAQAIRLKEK
ncbi:MAG: hypothetical protein AAB372_03140 [Patescibacteria group bacterium]